MYSRIITDIIPSSLEAGPKKEIFTCVVLKENMWSKLGQEKKIKVWFQNQLQGDLTGQYETEITS